MKKMNKKGFTLAELLIVIAIIAVLIAIAIPTFSGALDNAKRQTDHANIRSAYSVMQVAKLTGIIENVDHSTETSTITWFMQKDGSFSKETTGRSDYTLKVNGNDTCDGCAGCDGYSESATSSHTQNNVIKIVYTPADATNAAKWELQLTTAS